MVGFCIEHGFILRLIEAMPMGDTGRNARYLDVQPVLARLRDTFGLTPQTATLGGGPARYWATADGRFTPGGDFADFPSTFAPPATACALSVDGTLYMCLGQEEAWRCARSCARHQRRRAGKRDSRRHRTQTRSAMSFANNLARWCASLRTNPNESG